MYCKNCRSPLNPNANVCGNCGTRVEKTASLAARKLVSKPLLIIAASLILFQIVFTFTGVMSSNSSLTYQMGYDMAEIVSAVSLVLCFFVCLPDILEVIGMYILSANSGTPGKATGCGLLKASYIIKLVYMCLLLLLMFIALLGVFIGIADSGSDSGAAVGAILVAFLLVIAGFVMAICYWASMIKCASLTNGILRGNEPYGNYSLYPVVMNFIMIVFYVIYMVASGFILSTLSRIGFFESYVSVMDMSGNFISTLVTVLVLLLRSIMCIKARGVVYSEFISKRSKYNPAPYGNAQFVSGGVNAGNTGVNSNNQGMINQSGNNAGQQQRTYDYNDK